MCVLFVCWAYTSWEHKLEFGCRGRGVGQKMLCFQTTPRMNKHVHLQVNQQTTNSFTSYYSAKTLLCFHLRIISITVISLLDHYCFIITTCWKPLQFSRETMWKRSASSIQAVFDVFSLVKCPLCCSMSQDTLSPLWLGRHSTVFHRHPGPVWLRLQEQESCTLITPQPL